MRTIASAPAIICHHCGRDYARTFWDAESYYVWHGLEPRPSPICCPSCCRDTNPDAADAPQWRPPIPAVEVARAAIVTPARKQCRTCGAEWDGLIFGPAASKGSPLPFGTCPVCAAKDEAAVAQLSAPRVAATGGPLRLTRPRRVAAPDDDGRYGA